MRYNHEYIRETILKYIQITNKIFENLIVFYMVYFVLIKESNNAYHKLLGKNKTFFNEFSLKDISVQSVIQEMLKEIKMPIKD